MAREVIGRLMVPQNIKPGETFSALLEVKSLGGDADNVRVTFMLPEYLSTGTPLEQSIGPLKDGFPVNVTWTLATSDDAAEGTYYLEVSLEGPKDVKAMQVKTPIGIVKISFVRVFKEGVYTFLEQSVAFAAENPAVAAMPVWVFVALAYLYWRMRR